MLPRMTLLTIGRSWTGKPFPFQHQENSSRADFHGIPLGVGTLLHPLMP